MIQVTEPGEITSVTITPTNTTNGAATSYLVTFVTSIDIYAYENLILLFPEEITLPSSSSISCSGSRNINSLDCSVSSNTLYMTMKSLSVSTGTFSFYFSTVTNSHSTEPVTGFTFNLKTSIYDIGQYTGSMSVTTDTPAYILTYSLTQDSYISGATTTYTIKFTPTNKISDNGSIKITYPSTVEVDDDESCIIETRGSFSSLCDFDTRDRTIEIKDAFRRVRDYYTDEIEIELEEVINPVTNQYNEGFLIETFDDNDMEYRVDIIGDIALVPQLECDYPCKTCLSTDRTNCQSCYTFDSYPYLQEYSSSGKCKTQCDYGYTSNGNSFKVCEACDVSCLDCYDNGADGDKYKCLACHSDYSFWYETEKRCFDTCGYGYYQLSSTTCGKCTGLCADCENSATSCIACFESSSKPYVFDSTCIDECPIGYASINRVCTKCESPCTTCYEATDQCLTCDGTDDLIYAFGFQCYSECPDGTIQNSETMQCDGCLAGCKVCDD